MGNGKSPTVIRDPDSTNTSPVTTNSKCGARVVNHLHRRTIERPSRSTGSLRSRPPTKNCFSTKQETSASRQNLERGGVSEQGLIGAGNRWLTGPRRPKPPNHRPSWASQYRSVEELPPLSPAVRRELPPPGRHRRGTEGAIIRFPPSNMAMVSI